MTRPPAPPAEATVHPLPVRDRPLPLDPSRALRLALDLSDRPHRDLRQAWSHPRLVAALHLTI